MATEQTLSPARQVLITKIIAAATSYGFVILLAQLMPATQFGLVALFLNLALLVSVVGARGQQMALLRFLPQFLSQKRDAEIPNLIAHAHRRALSGTALASVACAVVFLIVRRGAGAADFDLLTLLLGLALIPMVGWIDILSHTARGLRHYLLSLIPKEILWRAISAAVIIAIYITGARQSLTASTTLATLLLVLMGIAVALNRVIRHHLDQFSHAPATATPAFGSEWRQASVPFWISSVSNIFLANADVLVVGLLVGPRQAGIYFAANRLAQVLAFFTTSYNVVIAPQLASAWYAGQTSRTANILREATIKSTLATLGMGVAIWVLSTPLLGLFGSEFQTASLALKILVAAGIINAAFGPADIALNMCGFDRLAMKVSIASMLFGTAALIIGAILAQATGVALAVLLATVFRKICYWGLATRQMSLRTDIFAQAQDPSGLQAAHS